MSAASAATFVKKSVGWSIGLSVLMIVAGILAIASPMAAGIAVNILVAWLLVFSGCTHLVFAWYTRTAGGFLSELLLGILYIFIGVSICSRIRWPAFSHSRSSLRFIYSRRRSWNLSWDSHFARFRDRSGSYSIGSSLLSWLS